MAILKLTDWLGLVAAGIQVQEDIDSKKGLRAPRRRIVRMLADYEEMQKEKERSLSRHLYRRTVQITHTCFPLKLLFVCQTSYCCKYFVNINISFLLVKTDCLEPGSLLQQSIYGKPVSTNVVGLGTTYLQRNSGDKRASKYVRMGGNNSEIRAVCLANSS